MLPTITQYTASFRHLYHAIPYTLSSRPTFICEMYSLWCHHTLNNIPSATAKHYSSQSADTCFHAFPQDVCTFNHVNILLPCFAHRIIYAFIPVDIRLPCVTHRIVYAFIPVDIRLPCVTHRIVYTATPSAANDLTPKIKHPPPVPKVLLKKLPTA